MGQYYRPIFLNKEKTTPLAFVMSYDFGSGVKLMEHSWMKNHFVGFVERQLLVEPRPIVWAGDYADNEEGTDRNLYDLTVEAPKLTHNQDVENKYGHNFKTALPKRFKYLINYDKKEFVDKTKTPLDKDGWQIHPLPLLTCEGNNRGGGDFRGKEKKLVGRWSRDTIGISSKKGDIPKDFKEIVFDLKE